MWKLRFCCIYFDRSTVGPSSRIYGLKAVISPAKSKQTIEEDLCGLAKMVTNASSQEQRLNLPTFSGEDKTNYESWKAAFMSIVDRLDIPVCEKMLRLLNILNGRALTLVKDLGCSTHAYEGAKDKLDKKYGGERRSQIKHLTSLVPGTWSRVRPPKSWRHGGIPSRIRKRHDSAARQWSRQGAAGTKLEPYSQGKAFRRECSSTQVLAYRSFFRR